MLVVWSRIGSFCIPLVGGCGSRAWFFQDRVASPALKAVSLHPLYIAGWKQLRGLPNIVTSGYISVFYGRSISSIQCSISGRPIAPEGGRSSALGSLGCTSSMIFCNAKWAAIFRSYACRRLSHDCGPQTSVRPVRNAPVGTGWRSGVDAPAESLPVPPRGPGRFESPRRGRARRCSRGAPRTLHHRALPTRRTRPRRSTDDGLPRLSLRRRRPTCIAGTSMSSYCFASLSNATLVLQIM